MSRTVSDALTQTRVILQDTDVPYRYETTELYRYLNDSLAEMRRIRPDIFIGRFITELPKFSTGDENKKYPLSDMFFPATVNYMVYMAEMREDQSVANGRAASFLQIFAAQMGG